MSCFYKNENFLKIFKLFYKNFNVKENVMHFKRLNTFKYVCILYSGQFLNVLHLYLNLDMKENLVSKNAPTQYFNDLKKVFGYLYYFIRNKICILSKQILNIFLKQSKVNFVKNKGLKRGLLSFVVPFLNKILKNYWVFNFITLIRDFYTTYTMQKNICQNLFRCANSKSFIYKITEKNTPLLSLSAPNTKTLLNHMFTQKKQTYWYSINSFSENKRETTNNNLIKTSIQRKLIENITLMYEIKARLPKDLGNYYQKHYIKCITDASHYYNLSDIVYASLHKPSIYDDFVSYLFPRWVTFYFRSSYAKKEPFLGITLYCYFFCEYRNNTWLTKKDLYKFKCIINAYNKFYENTLSNGREVTTKCYSAFMNTINDILKYLPKKHNKKKKRAIKRRSNFTWNAKYSEIFKDSYITLFPEILSNIEKRFFRKERFSFIIKDTKDYPDNYLGYLNADTFIKCIKILDLKHPKLKIIKRFDDLGLFVNLDNIYVTHDRTNYIYYQYIDNIYQNLPKISENKDDKIENISKNIFDMLKDVVIPYENKSFDAFKKITELKNNAFSFKKDYSDMTLANHELEIILQKKKFDKNIASCNTQFNDFIIKLEKISADITTQLKKNQAGIVIIKKKLSKILKAINKILKKVLIKPFKNLGKFLNDLLNKLEQDLNNNLFTITDIKKEKAYIKLYHSQLLQNLNTTLVNYIKKKGLWEEQNQLEKNILLENIKDEFFVNYYKRISNLYHAKINLITLLFQDPNKTELSHLTKEEVILYLSFFKEVFYTEDLIDKILLDPTQGLLVLYYYGCSYETKKRNWERLINLLQRFNKHLMKYLYDIKPLDLEFLNKKKVYIFRLMLERDPLETDYLDLELSPVQKSILKHTPPINYLQSPFKAFFTNDILLKQYRNLTTVQKLNLRIEEFKRKEIPFHNDVFLKLCNNVPEIIYEIIENYSKYSNSKLQEFIIYIINHNASTSHKFNLLSILFSDGNIKSFKQLKSHQFGLALNFFSQIIICDTEASENFFLKLLMDISGGFGILKYYVYKIPYFSKIDYLDMFYLEKFILNYQIINNMPINKILVRNVQDYYIYTPKIKDKGSCIIRHTEKPYKRVKPYLFFMQNYFGDLFYM